MTNSDVLFDDGELNQAFDIVSKLLVSNPFSVPASLKAALLGSLLQTEANGIVSELNKVAAGVTRIEPAELRALLDVYVRVYVEEVLNGKIVSGASITRHTREARKKLEERGKRGFIRSIFGDGSSDSSLIEEGEQLAAMIEVANGEYNSLQVEIARLKAEIAKVAQSATQDALKTSEKAEAFAMKCMQDAEELLAKTREDAQNIRAKSEQECENLLKGCNPFFS
jgi:hypothetical protein